MRNEKFRKALDAYVDEMEFDTETILLDNSAYDNSIVGITEDGHVVYDFNKMVEEYMADNNCDELDAIEWIEYNTLRAIPYMGEGRPIIINETVESISEKY